LAVRIAAANLAEQPDHGVGAYADELAAGDRLAALTTDDVAIRRCFTQSYRQLRPAARTLFRRLGLITGPSFTASAAQAVGGGVPAGDAGTLHQLVRAHLVERHGTDRVPAARPAPALRSRAVRG
jgi:hypothetical protein